jgi:dihydroorotase
MEIMIYSKGKIVERYNFKPQELDKIKDFCYNNNIKWYILKYSEKEIMEYEQFSKGHN